jgi:hypothetical protein
MLFTVQVGPHQVAIHHGRTVLVSEPDVGIAQRRGAGSEACLVTPGSGAAMSDSPANTPEDSFVSRAGFVQPVDRVCIELEAHGANDLVELQN